MGRRVENKQLKDEFFKKFAYVPNHEMAGWKWKEDTGSKDAPDPVMAWRWIEKQIEQAEKKEREKWMFELEVALLRMGIDELKKARLETELKYPNLFTEHK